MIFIKINKIKIVPLFGLIVLVLIFFNCSDVVNDYSTLPRAGFCLTFDDDYIEDWYRNSNLFLTNNINATFFISDLDSLSQYEINLLYTSDI